MFLPLQEEDKRKGALEGKERRWRRKKKRPLVDKGRLLENFDSFKQNYLFSPPNSRVILPLL